MHGGKVENTFSPSNHHPVPHKTHKRFMNCIVISDQMRRTLKYLMAVVHGNPIINVKWIIDCCRQQTLLPYEKHRLASGFSLEDRTPVFVFVLHSAIHSFIHSFILQFIHSFIDPRLFVIADTFPKTHLISKDVEFPPNIFDQLRCEVTGNNAFKV